MFGQLFIKECRQISRSIIYWLCVFALVFNYAVQLGSMEIMPEPEKGQAEYGYKQSDDEKMIMRLTLGQLLEEYARGEYTTYPIGFYKRVTLSPEEEKQIGKIIEEAAGLSGADEVEEKISGWYSAGTDTVQAGGTGEEDRIAAAKPMEMEPAAGLTYERFEALMDKADDILGGGSSYGKKYRRKNAKVPMTYGDALKAYDDLIEKDCLTGGYARLFSDYMIIFLGILPVFLAVAESLRDRRAGMEELIFTRRCPSVTIVASRYLAMVVMLVLPVLALSVRPLFQCLKYASAAGVSVDISAFVKYTFGWIFPTIMAVTAVGMILTELTGTALAILVQGAWWFICVFAGSGGIEGGMYGWNLIPRHNTELNWTGYHENFSQLVSNRVLYAFAAVILAALTAFIYSQKRKGRYRISWKNIGRLKK